MRRVFVLLLAAYLAAAVMPAGAQPYTGTLKPQLAETDRFAANNSLFVLYHELAHLLIDRLHLPVLGREEDAADNMASWALLNIDTKQTSQALADAARGWILTGTAYGEEHDDEDYAGPHSLDRQRAMHIVCLMVGSNAKAFRAIANQYAIGTDRQESCKEDYVLIDVSLRSLFGPKWPEDAGGTVVHVTYYDAGPDLKSTAAAFRRSGVLDYVDDHLRQYFNIQPAVRFTAKRCDEANAYYDPDTLEIIFCYELMQDYEMLYAAELARSGSVRRPGSDQTAKPFRGPQ